MIENQLTMKNKTTTPSSYQKNHREAFLYFMSIMDVEMVHLILDNEKKYQHGGDKDYMAGLLKEAFREFKSMNDEYLIVQKGRCINKTCNFGCTGYSFIGNYSNAHLDLIAKGSKTNVEEVFECLSFRPNKGKKSDGPVVSIFGPPF